MRVALLADAHANLPALKAVLKDAELNQADEVWYLGDFLGYGPFPSPVVSLLKRSATELIVGNYDLNVLNFSQNKTHFQKKKHPSKYFLFSWTDSRLSRPSRKYLQGLPQSVSIERNGLRFLLVHGSPEGIDDPLTAQTSKKRFAHLGKNVSEDVVLCGHTHEFFDFKVKGVRFINPGSCGRPFDGDYRASYAILDFQKNELVVENRRLDYDLRKTLRKMKEQKFPADVILSIQQGLSLDAVHSIQEESRLEQELIEQVVHLARSCDYEEEHAHQVTKLALKIFDELQGLHQLGARQRLLLQSASLLHDIGWVKGRIGHHKTSRDLILKADKLPLSEEERVIVALVARYHRKALPDHTHKYFNQLKTYKQDELKKLAAVLRIADALDRRHLSVVKDLHCCVTPENVIISVIAEGSLKAEQWAVEKKSNLFQDVFQKAILIKKA